MIVNYAALFESCKLTDDPGKLRELDWICKTITSHFDIYRTVEKFVTVPWFVVAAIHFRESSQSFSRHLHNGDPLTERTVHVPKGRPTSGQPPFSWIDSAVDALAGLKHPKAWTLPACLEFLERYNGFGYRRYGIYTPYLWNYTDAYTIGGFVADGHFDPERVEHRPGCVAIFKSLTAKGVALEFSTGSSPVPATNAQLH